MFFQRILDEILVGLEGAIGQFIAFLFQLLLNFILPGSPS